MRDLINVMFRWFLFNARIALFIFAVLGWAGQLLPSPPPQGEWRIAETSEVDGPPVRSVLGFEVTDSYDGTLTLGLRMLLIGSERALYIENIHKSKDGRVVLALRGREPVILFLKGAKEHPELVWEDGERTITFVARDAKT